MSIYVGTAGWSYPKGNGRWDGVFYPDRIADRDKLQFYARYFSAVELNSSFYRPPNPHVARAWANKVPDGFRFTAKLWQKFTHPRMFKEATGEAAQISEDDFHTFLEGVEPLAEAGKLGPILAQFPPSFKPEPGALEYLEDLVRRLRGAGYGLAVELRHRDWTDRRGPGDEVRALFQDQQVAWTIIDEPKFKTSIRDIPLTGQVGYIRFHGRNYAQWWRHDAAEDRYNYLYGSNEQEGLASDVREIASQTQDTYVFYNNHYRAKAVVNAIQMNFALGLPIGAPPPEELLAEYPELAGIGRE